LARYASAGHIVSALAAAVQRTSRAAVAGQAGVPKSRITEWLRGERAPNAKIIEALGYEPEPFYRKRK
jgi:transcriptional regulator with XRE-family HTH domain